jgi:acyl-coenzyme A thioesterase PaaI-like protein
MDMTSEPISANERDRLQALYEPGLVHGGMCALVLDQLLGEAASDGLTKPLFTGTITLKYLRGTPLGLLRAGGARRTHRRHQDLRTRYPQRRRQRNRRSGGRLHQARVGQICGMMWL